MLDAITEPFLDAASISERGCFRPSAQNHAAAGDHSLKRRKKDIKETPFYRDVSRRKFFFRHRNRQVTLYLSHFEMLHHAGPSDGYEYGRCAGGTGGYRQNGNDERHGKSSRQIRRRLQLFRSNGLSRIRQNLQGLSTGLDGFMMRHCESSPVRWSLRS